MSGQSNFPTALDSDSSLFDVADGVNSLLAAHHNNLKEAIKAMQAKAMGDIFQAKHNAEFGNPFSSFGNSLMQSSQLGQIAGTGLDRVRTTRAERAARRRAQHVGR